MALLVVPAADPEPWPTLGPAACDFLEERSIYGPGSLKGEPYVIDTEFRAQLYKAYEVYPQKASRTIKARGRGGIDIISGKHPLAGRRRFKRVVLSVRKGLAKTEKAAQVTYLELHPEGPARCDGFDSYGRPVGRPVADPYIPMLAVTVEQVEELAYGALYVLCTEGPDADYFDSSLDRVIRLDMRGHADGKAVPLSNSPGARDGGRTSFQNFDEPHRLYLPRHLAAHETMVANLEKRVLEDPWGLYVGTAGEPGQGSVAEGLHAEAEQIAASEISDPQLFYFYRWAKGTYNLKDLDERIDAVEEATGPIGEYGPGQFESIAKQWDRPKADRSYLERVWLNRWTRSEAQAFDPNRWADDLAVPEPLAKGAFVVAGFDGARFRDATAIVLTDIVSGKQQAWATWERPLEAEEWEVPEAEVTAAWEQIIEYFDLWIAFCDPPHWTETVGSWAARWPDQFEEWWTNRTRQMALATRGYREAMLSGALTHVSRPGNHEDETFDRHIAAAGRKDTNLWDQDAETGEQIRLFVLQKLHPDRKFDTAMAGCLSWQARLHALKKGAKSRAKTSFVPYRIR
jgi:hypothetical protein